MIRAEIKKYFKTRLFWILNVLGIGLLIIYSLLMAGMDRVGLMSITSFEYLIGANNTFVTTLFPLLVCLFSAYVLDSEYRWRTMMMPIMEGVVRSAILRGKVILCLLATLTFALVYLVGSVGVAFGLFSSQDMLLENRVISYLEATGRITAAIVWTALIVFLFGLLAMLLVAEFHNLTLAAVGSFLGFLGFMFTSGVKYNPFGSLLQVANLLLHSAHLINLNFGLILLKGLGVWLITGGAILGLFLTVFHHQDIVLE